MLNDIHTAGQRIISIADLHLISLQDLYILSLCYHYYPTLQAAVSSSKVFLAEVKPCEFLTLFSPPALHVNPLLISVTMCSRSNLFKQRNCSIIKLETNLSS